MSTPKNRIVIVHARTNEIMDMIPRFVWGLLGARRLREIKNKILEGMLNITPEGLPPLGTEVWIEYDDFTGSVIGYYTKRNGDRGVVLQQDTTKVVHVYGEKRLQY